MATCHRQDSSPEERAQPPQYSGGICLEQGVMDDTGYIPKMVEGVGFRPGASGPEVCLIVDNCTAHHTDVQLSNTEVKFLPPNTMSKQQPLNQGIIRTFKSIYKCWLINILLVELRMGQDLKVDLLGAIKTLKASWANVKQPTTANCFGHAGFIGRTKEASEDATKRQDWTIQRKNAS